jgi:hypothetical protein
VLGDDTSLHLKQAAFECNAAVGAPWYVQADNEVTHFATHAAYLLLLLLRAGDCRV